MASAAFGGELPGTVAHQIKKSWMVTLVVSWLVCDPGSNACSPNMGVSEQSVFLSPVNLVGLIKAKPNTGLLDGDSRWISCSPNETV